MVRWAWVGSLLAALAGCHSKAVSADDPDAQAGASGASGASGDVPAETPGGGSSGVEIVPNEGWVDGSSNPLGIQGAAYVTGDAATRESLTSDFEESRLCMRGVASQVDIDCSPAPPAQDCFQLFFGAILGLNLNQSESGAEVSPYDASDVAGFSFDVVGESLPEFLRFSVEAESGKSYCLPPPLAIDGTAGSWHVALNDLVTECQRAPLTSPRFTEAESAITSLRWAVSGTTNRSVPFDFCIENLRVQPQ